VHIGSGTDLLAKFDYESRAGYTYVLNQDEVYSYELKRNPQSPQLDKSAAQLCPADQWKEGSPYIRYILSGETTIEQISEQIKDIHGQCYLPGSSLKGALRTALLWYAQASEALAQADVQYEETGRGRYVAEKAAGIFEKIAFRPSGQDDAKSDLLRALQVSDSDPLPISPSPLELCSVRVFTQADEPPGSPIEVEAVRPQKSFTTEIKIDELAIQYADRKAYPRAAQELQWSKRLFWLIKLVDILQQVSCQRIPLELESIRAKGFKEAENFYQVLLDQANKLTGTNRAILQIGWGTGWNGMTIGQTLNREQQNLARQRFQLGRQPGVPGAWEPVLSKAFPSSKRLKTRGTGTEAQAGIPLGWVELTFEPAGKPLKEGEWAELVRQAEQAFKPLRGKPVSAVTVESPKPIRTPPPPPPPKPPLTDTFTSLPKPGDRFRGNVWFTDTDGSLFIEIPGLSAEDYAAAIISRKQIGPRRYKDGEQVICTVDAVEKDEGQPGHWLVRCSLE
jgi:CRISPR-associated protein Csm5